MTAARFRFVFLFAFATIATHAVAQSVSLPLDGVFVPGRYQPLTIDADGPGLIQIRGPGLLGIDWPAGGRGRVTVPLLSWNTRDGDMPITINGQPATLAQRPTTGSLTISTRGDAAAVTAPPEMKTIIDRYAMADTLDGVTRPPPAGPTSAMFDDAFAIPTTGWSPGRPAETKRWIVLTAVAAVLVIAVAAALLIRPAATGWRRHGATGVLIVSVGLTAALTTVPQLSRRDAYRSVGVRVDGPRPQTDVWAYRTSAIDQTVREPWAGLTWLMPTSPTDLANLDPVMVLSAAGDPIAIDTQVAPGRSAIFLHRFDTAASVTLAEPAVASALVRRLYDGDATVRSEWVILSPRP